ncbi:MAG TPA: DinB family protein [Dehalococcoidia bacterium]|nr:DinB family protein [Dehalococcoidia bacterium]
MAALSPAALDVLEHTPSVLRAILAPLPAVVAETPGAEGWSPHDVAAHLASLTGPTFVDRVTLMLEQDDPLVPGIDEHEILEASGLRGKPLAALLDGFEAHRKEAVAWARGITPEQLARTGRHQVAGPLTVAEIINHKAWHDLMHIRQALTLIGEPLDEGRGAMRIFT